MKILYSCLTLLALSLGCAGPDVHFDYDTRASYQGFHTFDWYAASKPAQARSAGVQNPLMDTRVRRAVETELAARNFRQETSTDPDFLITYYPVYHPRRDGRSRVGLGMGFGPLGLGVSAPVGERPTGKIGSIVLEIQDFKTHQLVWKAEAVDVLDDADAPEDSNQDVARAVRKMLKRFPPAH